MFIATKTCEAAARGERFHFITPLRGFSSLAMLFNVAWVASVT